jgi:hypothetical protein
MVDRTPPTLRVTSQRLTRTGKRSFTVSLKLDAQDKVSTRPSSVRHAITISARGLRLATHTASMLHPRSSVSLHVAPHTTRLTISIEVWDMAGNQRTAIRTVLIPAR